MKKPLVYLDYAAATPVHPDVLKTMMPYMKQFYGNASSVHRFGQKSRQAIDKAREDTAEILQCNPREILFTSGGTESNNLFIFGAAEIYKKFGRHIIATKIEHDSVLKPLETLGSRGFEITYLDVGKDGIIDPEDVKKALRPDTIFATVMYANNEIGTIQPIFEISGIIKNYRAGRNIPFFHTDACQAAPYLDISAKKLGVDAMTLNGGKIYGPKGAGALFIKEGIKLMPQIFGGGQEYRVRSGTENVPAIVGFAKALQLVQKDRKRESKRLCFLRDRLMRGILKNIPEARLNGDAGKRLPNNVNVSFRGLEGESVLLKLDALNIAVSAGSACSSGSLEPSHVIRALGLTEEWTHSATRFTLGSNTIKQDIDYVLKKMPSVIAELREFSAF